MVKSSKGFRSRSRGVFTKKVRERGLLGEEVFHLRERDRLRHRAFPPRPG